MKKLNMIQMRKHHLEQEGWSPVREGVKEELLEGYTFPEDKNKNSAEHTPYQQLAKLEEVRTRNDEKYLLALADCAVARLDSRQSDTYNEAQVKIPTVLTYSDGTICPQCEHLKKVITGSKDFT